MKRIHKFCFLIFLLSLSVTSKAGEFSKIDVAVREKMVNFFQIEFKDIHSLEIVENEPQCLLTIEAKLSKTTQWSEDFYQVTNCVTRVETNGFFSYQVEVLDFSKF